MVSIALHSLLPHLRLPPAKFLRLFEAFKDFTQHLITTPSQEFAESLLFILCVLCGKDLIF